jgi:uncharacterized membrane protein YdjX (TVP38/TMEM64 family)
LTPWLVKSSGKTATRAASVIQNMRNLLKPLLLIALVLAVPVLPFLGFGQWMETEVQRWAQTADQPGTVAAVVVGLLATDVFLPVPSSLVSTLAGDVLGFAAATAASWLGLTLGCLIGFALARRFGRLLAARLCGADELQRMDRLAQRFGPTILVVARPVPVLAEASVLLMGCTRLSWWKFLLPIAVVNLLIAAGYSALGTWVHLPAALALAIALPVVTATMARRWLDRRDG